MSNSRAELEHRGCTLRWALRGLEFRQWTQKGSDANDERSDRHDSNNTGYQSVCSVGYKCDPHF